MLPYISPPISVQIGLIYHIAAIETLIRKSSLKTFLFWSKASLSKLVEIGSLYYIAVIGTINTNGR